MRPIAAALLIALLFTVQGGVAGAAEVRIRDYKFVPEKMTVKAGATVKWTNEEKRASHSIVFPAERLESERLLNGESWARRFDKPGLYPYTCEPHPEMKGSIEVTP